MTVSNNSNSSNTTIFNSTIDLSKCLVFCIRVISNIWLLIKVNIVAIRKGRKG